MTDDELNRLVAEKVMGWTPWFEKRGDYTHVVWQKAGQPEPYRSSRDWEAQVHRYEQTTWSAINPGKHINHLDHFQPATSIADAWEVVKNLEGPFSLYRQYESNPEQSVWGWAVCICLVSGETCEECGQLPDGHRDAWAETASRAICIAALQAKGINLEETE